MGRVDIPKGDVGTRPLGIPTVADRIAQTVVKRYLEPILEEHFQPDSYGEEPGKSAIEAVGSHGSDAGGTTGSWTSIWHLGKRFFFRWNLEDFRIGLFSGAVINL